MARRPDRDPTREDDARERGHSDREEPFPLEDEVEVEALDEGEESEETGLPGDEDEPEEKRAPGRRGGGAQGRRPGEAGAEGATKRQEPGRTGERGQRPAGPKVRKPGRG